MHARRYPRWFDLLVMLTIVPAFVASVAVARAESAPVVTPRAAVLAAHFTSR